MTTLSQNQFQEMDASDLAKLKNSNKDQLLGYIQLLRGKVEELVSYQLVAKRVQLLERSHLNALQYNRRESIEIHGVPRSITDDTLESYCLEALGEIGCGDIQAEDVHACHRLRNKDKTIMRFVNRKHADMSLHNRKKLKDIDRAKYKIPEESRGLFINESLCKPVQFLFYKVRLALKSKKIDSFNMWKGKLSLKIQGNEHFISHIDDLIELNLADEGDQILFFK